MSHIRQLIFCSGMKRSGSTWSYNVCRFLLENAYGESRVAKGYVGEGKAVEEVIDGAHEGNRAVAGDRDTFLLKFHYPTARLVELVVTGQAKNIFTYRDPLDALASEIDFFKLPFDTALQNILLGLRAMQGWRRHPGTLFVDFENINTRPMDEIRRIAEHLGLQPDEAILERCAEQNSYQKLKQLSEEMANWSPEQLTQAAGLTFDPVTLLHVGHAPKGAARNWRKTLTTEQAEAAIEAMKPWLPEAYKASLNES